MKSDKVNTKLTQHVKSQIIFTWATATSQI